MTITYAEAIARKLDGEPRKSHRLFKLSGWLGVLMPLEASGAILGLPRGTLDDMSEALLDDIGMRRISRRVMWLVCRESPFSVDFRYRSALDDHRIGGDRHAP